MHVLLIWSGYSSTNLAVRYHPARVACLYALDYCLCNRIIVWCVQDVPAGWSYVQVFLTWTDWSNSIGSSVLLQAILCTETKADVVGLIALTVYQ